MVINDELTKVENGKKVYENFHLKCPKRSCLSNAFVFGETEKLV